MKKAFEHRHVVGFEETNLIGNVYYVNHLRWQGRTRELFLRQYAPDVLAALSGDLVLATVRCSCEYFSELFAFDEVIVRMRLGALVQNRVTMLFEYWRQTEGGEELVARGEQEIACLQREGKKVVPVPVPKSLREALAEFGDA
jgi:enediyne biosynthesis thioesterase